MKKISFTFNLLIISAIMMSCSTFSSLDSTRVASAGANTVAAFSITNSEVVSLCKEYMVQMDDENTVSAASSKYTTRLNTITKKFKNISNMDVNFAVYESSTVNAFSCGDGSIRVYSGLMDVMTDDELFAVIGHELGHIKNNDSRENMRNAYLAVAARQAVGSVNTTVATIIDSSLGDIAATLATSAYSRTQEYAADEAALNYCIANGIDKYAMYKALNVLVMLGGSSNSGIVAKVSQLLATHPDSAKRATRIKTMADAL